MSILLAYSLLKEIFYDIEKYKHERKQGTMEVLKLILPVFGILLTGFFVKLFKLVKEELAYFLIQFILYVSVPALLIRVIAMSPLEEIYRSGFVFSFGLIFPLFVLFIFFYKYGLRKSVQDSILYALSMTMSNAGFVGLPILYAVFGRQAIFPATLSIVMVIVLLTLSLVILEVSICRPLSIRNIFSRVSINLLKNPLIISTLIGILYSLSALPKPAPLFTYLQLLEGAVTPCALVAIGMQIEPKTFFQDFKATFFVSLFKLVILPIFVLVLVFALHLPSIWAVSAVIVSALPTAKSCIMVCGLYEDAIHSQIPQKISMVIAVTTLLSVFTLFIWLIVLAKIFPEPFLSHPT